VPDVEVTTTGVAAGGDAIARDESGRVVFVEGALPGETVRVAVTDERRDFLRGRVVEVLSPSPDRVEPGCAEVGRGCGGCPWQGVAVEAQRRMKRDVVIDALRRVGRVPYPPVADEVRSVAPSAYRTTVRVGVLDGRAGYRMRHSHDLVAVEGCVVAHPLVEELIREGRFDGADEVVLRVGARTGDRLVLARPTAAGVSVPPGVVVVGEDAPRARLRKAAFTEVAAERRWRISATSFFQSGPEAADLLVAAVRAAVGDALVDGGTVVDAYAGVGLLGGSLAGRRDDVDVVAVEGNATAVRDARHNLADVEAEVVHADVGRWDGTRSAAASVVVADPARAGLGKRAVAALAAAEAPVFVLVACDPAALARDTTLLAAAGYRLESVQVLDLFPHTVHVEAVARFTRT
jgi:23S rRNA (uracil1939-C5)-methyltransferase